MSLSNDNFHSRHNREPLHLVEMPRIFKHATAKDESMENALIRSPLVSNAVKKYRLNNDDQLEKTINRKHLVDEKRRRNQTLVMSPAHIPSPKAHPSTTIKSPTNSIGFSGMHGTSLLHASKFSGLPISPPSGQLGDGNPLTITKNVPIEQMSKHFEEWMKIATDNKINAKNSWSLALIDYFSELTLLREGDGINFQKASCTLDGCIKIYSSRVDSVADETDKLLNGLMDDKEESNSKVSKEQDDSMEEAQPQSGATSKEKKKSHASTIVNTLEKNVENLNLKKFETEPPPSIVPIFIKISTLFDENCSRSFLLGTIPINNDGELSFNSSSLVQSNVYHSGDDFNLTEVGFNRNNFGNLSDKAAISSIKQLLAGDEVINFDSISRLVENLHQINTDLEKLFVQCQNDNNLANNNDLSPMETNELREMPEQFDVENDFDGVNLV